MIKQWIVTGDTHGNMSRFAKLTGTPDLGVIILGDAGCNYYRNKKDSRTKQQLEDTGCLYYLVRGNHEERPENIPNIISIYDENVQNEVFVEPGFSHIRYLKDGKIYTFNNHRTLVIGGAYSVDKEYRLAMGYAWFPQEQLTRAEMQAISDKVRGQKFDFVFSHTCPLSWEPTDLFLRGIDQSKVDKSMETWLDTLKEEIDYDVWLFGHYHADRIERQGVEMFFTEMEDLEATWNRWQDVSPSLGWWYDRSPHYDDPR